jgi:hypothetical protein
LLELIHVVPERIAPCARYSPERLVQQGYEVDGIPPGVCLLHSLRPRGVFLSGVLEVLRASGVEFITLDDVVAYAREHDLVLRPRRDGEGVGQVPNPTRYRPRPQRGRARVVEFACECSDPACEELVSLTIDEYEFIRHVPIRLVIRPGHLHPETERVVVEELGRFLIIEKFGPAGDVIAHLDPRGPTRGRSARKRSHGPA